MANVFMVEWDDLEKKQRVRQKVEFGNFDGNVEQAQRVLDQGWPYNYPDRRANWKVLDVFGSGHVEKITIPRSKLPPKE